MNIYHHVINTRDDAKVDKILAEIREMNQQRKIEMADLKQAFADLKAKIANQATVDNSIIVMIQGLRDQLQTLASQYSIDPADVQALVDNLDTEQHNLMNAVTAGTIAAPPGAAVPLEVARTSQMVNTAPVVETAPAEPVATISPVDPNLAAVTGEEDTLDPVENPDEQPV